ncbi:MULTISPECIES: CinA family protein [Chryseobacterium]|uniref:PncC family amidohydrolase n=1 Tax=Chryseobacterium geocarposphaerae TaxID=1416776 RepID=A0ABU1L8S3_9FLAO|nr:MULTISPECIES: nicotinamide-nucleotide amidohydrolase family protein [Chryseobacterium]MDR6403123.1 PncC family amidohydrolase [Chryseobacterium geocarposphaerae]MDR6696678.1 PncC family amidohydrolase [Chryseobacterium ginsenosidimutans]
MNLQKDLLEFIGNYLQENNETVSMAESVTAGFLQFSFSQIKNASNFFKGGMTTYTLEEKVKFLHVDKQEALQCDCVSQNIAETMALNVAELFNTDWGIAVTGYATPVEESNYQLFAYFSFSYKNKIIFSKKLDLNPRKESTNAQLCYSEFILECLKVEMDKQLILKQEHN